MPAEISMPATVGQSQNASTASHGDTLLAAYEGYWELLAAGEAITPDEYCLRYPTLQSSLPNLLRAHELLEEHESKLAAAEKEQDTAWPEAGDAFLEFELHRELGRGAFSRVYLATEPTLGGRWVALKVYKKPMGEARILGPLSHPNIVPINSLQLDHGRRMAAICMPYAGSSTLQRLLDLIGKEGVPPRARAILQAAEDTAAPQQLREQMPAVTPADVLTRGTYVDGVCHLGMQLADALAFIHKRGIFHRDLKPSNILLKPDGQPMLLDFNLSDEADKPMARMGGTLPYMSPEQLRAWWLCHNHPNAQKAGDISDDRTVQTQPRKTPEPPEVAGRADLFSLGVMLYELLTGVHPFGPIPVKVSVEQLHRLIHDRQQLGFKPIREVRPEVDTQLASVVERCLALHPDVRPQSADEVVEAFHTRLEQRQRQRARRNAWVAAAVLLLVVTIGGAGAFIGHRIRTDPEVMYAQAVAAVQSGDYRLAIDKTTEILNANADNSKARFLRARVYQHLSQWNKAENLNAIGDYRELEKQAKADGKVKAGLGYCRQNNSQINSPGGALQCYAGAIDNGYDTAWVRNNFGCARAAVGEHEEARKQFSAALEKDPNLQTALYNRAAACLNLYLSTKEEHYLRDGLKDVVAGLALGESADLYMKGAMLHARLAPNHPEEAAKAQQYLTEALKRGYPIGKSDKSFLERTLPDISKITETKSVQQYSPMRLIRDPLRKEDAPI